MSQSIFIYCSFNTPRLQYVLDWVFKTRMGISYTITDNKDHIANVHLAYGEFFPGIISIPSAGLLYEKGVQKHEIKTGFWNNIPTLFDNTDNRFSLPFDIFSAIFFLLSRYEEYYEYIPDKHGRYPATDSILYQYGWLERPLVDEWVYSLQSFLYEKMSLEASNRAFSFIPTYDIDIAWSYKNKGLTRNLGGIIKDILSGSIKTMLQRIAVLSNNKKDPYYSFEEITWLHKKFKLSPIYFVLVALRNGPFDKNISPRHPAMKKLIQFLSYEGIIGIHPSYETRSIPALLTDEKTILEKIVGVTITQSRQHYIRLQLPYTYMQLSEAGITDDYSMGYGTHLGFRAGTGAVFRWYNLNKEEPTSLHIHPFCFMDSTAHYELKLTASHAFERLTKMAELLKNANSRLITVFHNFSLGTDEEWAEWADAYANFLADMAE